ncbi:MAG: MFS transporter [Dysgonomonas sp.]
MPKKFLFAWPSRTISYAVGSVLLGYITYFATDYLGLSAATVGLVFMISKIFDGVTDVIAGYLIDRTKTKLGKGRPYELAIIGYWLCMVAMFMAPEMGVAPSVVYLFVMYSLVNSVFLTLLLCAEPVYLGNSLKHPDHSITVVSITGFISLIFTMAASMILPQLVATVGSTREGWGKIALVMGIPFTLLGLIRFFVISERSDISQKSESQMTIKEMVQVLKQNKYILIFSLIILLSNVGSNLVNSITTYYFRYIMGDISLASIMSLSMLAIIVVMVVTPALSKKFGFINIMRVTTLLGMGGYLIRLLNVHSLALLFVSNIFGMMGFYTMFSFASKFVIDCIDYGEWKTGIRSEGTIAAAQSVTAKIGAAVGAGAIGILMGLSGYVGTAATQTDSANMMIIMLYSIIPAAFCLIQFILLRRYDLEDHLPKIRAELEEKRKNYTT